MALTKIKTGSVSDSITLTSPDINTPDIDGGTIDGAAIGASSASTGAFTTLSASGTATVDALSTAFLNGDTNILLTVDADNDQTGKSFLVRDGSGKSLFKAEQGGDISFYNSGGSAAKLFWDASAESLGIGTVSPAYKTVISANGASGIEFGPAYSGTANLTQHYNRSGGVYVKSVNEAAEHQFNIGGSAKVNIDTAGRVGIGMTPAKLLDLQATDNLAMRFYNSTSFKAGIEVPTSSGDMITGSAVNDLAIRSQGNMLFAAGGATERMRISSAGVVTMPYQPSFCMTGSVAGGWVNSIGVLNFATTVTNNGGHYNTSAKRFVAPVAGVYSISATVLTQSSSSGHTYIRKNGSNYFDLSHQSAGNTNEYNQSGHTVCISLAVNDYVDVYLQQAYAGGAGLYVAGLYSSFSGYLIG